MSEEDFNVEPKLENKKKSKDFWLFLIFVDIIALVFFGFLAYQSISNKFAAPTPGKDNIPVKEVPADDPPATAVAQAPAQEPKLLTPTPEPKAEPKPQSALNDIPAQQPAPQTTPKPAEPEQPKVEKKQSVVIEPTKGKTRKVTFKYFDDAKNVRISSGFTMAKPQPLKKINGVWQASFIIYPGEYKYIFIVDGAQKLDPHAPEKDGRSLVVIP
ncbi:outer membrane biosynthesis protein TonB [Elusimicrobium simillimum]|uniref:hypothetical protein n=1 Tax=Elusimicrobium simillimum TaxID=3143438 RepID=UPI003C6FBA7B